MASLPQFSNVELNQFKTELDKLLALNLHEIQILVDQPEPYNWLNLMQPLEILEDRLERFWGPFGHLNAVVNTPEIRECYQSCLPQLSAYETAIGQNHALYTAIKAIERQDLNSTQIKIIDDALRDFRLSGVALEADKKQRYEVIAARLAELSHQFENNILDAVNAYTYPITDEKRLAGLPKHIIANARELAKEKGLNGWLLSLEAPCFQAVVTYGEDRALRQDIYAAYVTRASDQGPQAGKFDNGHIMDEILLLKSELAHLLGFANYAELSLASKMAETPEEVLDFLIDLGSRARPQAEKEFQSLKEFAKPYQAKLEPWDIAYFAEKQRQANYDISQEEVRVYFPLDQVMNGLLKILKRLYGVTLKAVHDFDTWHTDVQCYQVLDDAQSVRGYVYMDLFARANKRGGAWMDAMQSRFKKPNGEVQLPIATLTCNFGKTTDIQPTLYHDDLVTLFHEFGHCLHHVLTKVDYLSVSGVHGVEWDAVELPSQFFENWCWDQEALELLSCHVDTHETLPAVLFNKLAAAKNFQSAMIMLRQLEFALFDFRIHKDYQPTPNFIAEILAAVRKQIAVVPIAPFNRFQHSFSHIFGGGYAAGYYSYKWAEVLSSDAFARFEEEGIFNPQTGRDFLHSILEIGGSRKANEAYVAFRGQIPTIDAFLRHNGIGIQQ